MTKVLLTGSTGFLGNYIFRDLSTSTEVITLSRTSATIIADLSKEIIKLPSAEVVIHCAGKAHCIPKTEVEIQEFFQVNVNGTKNLLKSLELGSVLPKCFVFISSVSVYGLETGVGITEVYPLLAKDAYGLSKIEAEELVVDWCKNNNIICTILRLPLLVGQNPPGNLGAMTKAIDKGYYFNIAGGKARKSIVLAQDVASFIPRVAIVGGTYNLTDGYHPSFYELSVAIAKCIQRKKSFNLPLSVAKLMGYLGDKLGDKAPINSRKLKKITSDLTFDDTKAREVAGWKPRRVLEWYHKCLITS